MSESPVRVTAVRRIGAFPAPAASDSDLIAVEEPLQLEIEHGARDARVRVNAGVVLRTPGRDEHLASGLLFAEGFIAGAHEIERVETPAPGHLRIHLSPAATVDDRLARRVLVRSSACGLCGRDAIDDLRESGVAVLAEGPQVLAATLQRLPEALRGRQVAFNETGGLHAAALFDARGALISSAEDVGRHNAVDKLVGASLAGGMRGAAVLVVSGRAAFEIVHKALRARIPVLAAVGAPSSLAVETARAFNLTLAGFLREDRFNIYSGFDRIV